ncbi:putative cell survival pathways protein [Arachnomyces sp. PD_36]|nr:putative cell survival pathways protein [Arachnomyces sp. PD_36]
MNWFKQTLANVAGTQEPIYGPEAIQPVTEQAKTTPYTELVKEDFRWKAMESSCVETQTFYMISDEGTLGMVQVIYSNVNGIATTCTFNSKIFSKDPETTPHMWCSDTLTNHVFDEDMLSFGADNVAVTMNEDGASYSIKSAVNEDSLVNLTFKRTAPGFVVGKDGSTKFGTDHENPWGSMHHKFWPRCEVEGTITTKEKQYDFKGRGLYIHALQGMKPHHAAAKWTFVNFQTPTYSAVMMEFTTPPSYGSTVVNVGGVVKDNEIIYAGSSNYAIALESAQDSENDWPEPKSVRVNWEGKTKDDKAFNAGFEGELGQRTDRVDVMAEVPGFIKSIVGSVAGTKPYIYQYTSKDKFPLKIKIGDEEVEEKGHLFYESVFIC